MYIILLNSLCESKDFYLAFLYVFPMYLDVLRVAEKK